MLVCEVQFSGDQCEDNVNLFEMPVLMWLQKAIQSTTGRSPPVSCFLSRSFLLVFSDLRLQLRLLDQV